MSTESELGRSLQKGKHEINIYIHFNNCPNVNFVELFASTAP